MKFWYISINIIRTDTASCNLRSEKIVGKVILHICGSVNIRNDAMRNKIVVYDYLGWIGKEFKPAVPSDPHAVFLEM